MVGTEKKREGEVLEKTRQKTEEPIRYEVVLHNDDYTSMEFVAGILESLFSHSPASAYRIMMLVHRCGMGAAGVYSYEVAETKVAQVHERAKKSGFPLRATLSEV